MVRVAPAIALLCACAPTPEAPEGGRSARADGEGGQAGVVAEDPARTSRLLGFLTRRADEEDAASNDTAASAAAPSVDAVGDTGNAAATGPALLPFGVVTSLLSVHLPSTYWEASRSRRHWFYYFSHFQANYLHGEGLGVHNKKCSGSSNGPHESDAAKSNPTHDGD